MTRTEILNALIKKFNYTSYLEIGVGDGMNFDGVKCKYKTWVDIVPKPGTDEGTREFIDPSSGIRGFLDSSDRMFETFIRFKETEGDFWATFDLIFIDGDHHAEQVYKDIVNSLKVLKKGGCIVLHDCNPQTYEEQAEPRTQEHWMGGVWKVWSGVNYAIKKDETGLLDSFCVDTDSGCGIIKVDTSKTVTFPSEEYSDCFNDFWYLGEKRKELLNLITVKEFKQWLKK